VVAQNQARLHKNSKSSIYQIDAPNFSDAMESVRAVRQVTPNCRAAREDEMKYLFKST
jgi:hypothetical protein